MGFVLYPSYCSIKATLNDLKINKMDSKLHLIPSKKFIYFLDGVDVLAKI